MPTEHFKSKEAYRKSRAYTHIHGIPTHAVDVVVAGKKHKVKHRKASTKGMTVANSGHRSTHSDAMEAKGNYNYKRHWSQKKTGVKKKAPKRKRG